MDIKRILITGDDGYNSLGTRILVHLLKNDYDLSIAATKTQQSGVGGKLSMQGPFTWGKEEVEGVEAVWVQGTPIDVTEFAQGYFNKPFDLVISGINWGENVGPAVISSGTFCAAYRMITVQLTKRAIALSWKTPPETWSKMHNGTDRLDDYLEYPGKIAVEMIQLCLKEDMYGASLININFPSEKTNEYKITKLSNDITAYWGYPVKVDLEEMTYDFRNPIYNPDKNIDVTLDIGALNKGFITVNPIQKVFE